MHMADPPVFKLFGKKRTISTESWGPHLNSLEKFIFSVHFLEADDIVVLDKSAEVVMCLFPVKSEIQ